MGKFAKNLNLGKRVLPPPPNIDFGNVAKRAMRLEISKLSWVKVR